MEQQITEIQAGRRQALAITLASDCQQTLHCTVVAVVCCLLKTDCQWLNTPVFQHIDIQRGFTANFSCQQILSMNSRDESIPAVNHSLSKPAVIQDLKHTLLCYLTELSYVILLTVCNPVDRRIIPCPNIPITSSDNQHSVVLTDTHQDGQSDQHP